MWESNMCIDKATLAELELVQNKLEPAEVQARDRSPSPIPGIQRALFQVLVEIYQFPRLGWINYVAFLFTFLPLGWCHHQSWKTRKEKIKQAQSGGGTEKKFRQQGKQVFPKLRS